MQKRGDRGAWGIEGAEVVQKMESIDVYKGRYIESAEEGEDRWCKGGELMVQMRGIDGAEEGGSGCIGG